jgi:hypothetical protein
VADASQIDMDHLRTLSQSHRREEQGQAPDPS